MWDLSQQEPKQVKLIDGIIPSIKDKEYVDHCHPRAQGFSDIWCSSRDFAHDCSAVWHPSGQYFVVASRTHGTWVLVQTTALYDECDFQKLSPSLVTPGVRRPLSAAAPRLVQFMHSRYLQMVYTWPRPPIRM